MTKQEINIINLMLPLVKKSVWLQKVDHRDIMQDLFLKILEKYEKFAAVPEKEKLYYVTRVCKNMLIDKWRTRRKEYNLARITSIYIGDSNDDEKAEVSAALQIKDEIDRKMDLKEVMHLLKNYDKGDELLLNCEGYKVREIAEFTGDGINTVLGRMRYARNFLNKNYGQKN